jgi:hypothetical protein
MFRLFSYQLLGILFLISCSAPGPSQTEKDTAVPKDSSVTNPDAQGAKVVGADDNSLVTEVARNEVLLFGKSVDVMPAQLQQELSQAVIEMNLVMSNAGAVATGPLTLAYTTAPTAGMKKIFVGQPIKKRFTSAEGFSFLHIPAGTYYKMICNAEPGGTLEYHQKMQNLLGENTHAFGTPVLEIFSESRNNEMTVVSKATLLYPKK